MSYNFQETKDTLAHIEEWLRKEYSQISTGRANPILLDSIMIDSYGSKQPVKNVAAIHTEDARTLRIAPWDKSQIKDIERALTDSKLPFSIAVDSDGLRLHIPQLTEESKKISRQVGQRKTRRSTCAYSRGTQSRRKRS
ncbi:MAG: ribosome recycling factor [Candidatus Pacebacteria bacterium]|nr:ribosome recycling factor [Candidatus Paceibacterota bacterium]